MFLVGVGQSLICFLRKGLYIYLGKVGFIFGIHTRILYPGSYVFAHYRQVVYPMILQSEKFLITQGV